MPWTVETLGLVVDREIAALPVGLQARLVRLMEMIENVGLDRMREPHVKHVEGKLWELRAAAAEGIARGFYVTAVGRRVIVLHVFVKKTQKIPNRLSKQRAVECRRWIRDQAEATQDAPDAFARIRRGIREGQ